MSRHILLDSSPLSALCLPVAKGAPQSPITQWSRACIAAGHRLYVPEIIDYELRRELLRAGKTASLTELDNLKLFLNYLPLTTDAMLRAADLWAYARNSGIPTGDPKRLDIDVILAAQALTLPVAPADLIVATSNVSHISRFVKADLWTNIHP
ncbi:MAG TPA: PIN domain-containing protein [Chthonomonadaceae bacterium]|nr:PIN domain-containing protein [Chthonomonadaceae bacterium]